MGSASLRATTVRLLATPLTTSSIPCVVLVGLLVLSIFALQSYHFINHDVAFLVWAADQLRGGRIFGIDILDVNPPLCVLIYMPAVLLAQITGFDWGVRLWMLVLAALSVVTFWQTADRTLRLPLAAVLVLFVILAYPYHFAQREQIVLLLCAPYVAGRSPGKGWGVVSGVMAGVGFMMKPYFLIPLIMVFALRRKFGIEERAIVAMGVAYAVVLIVFFQPYIFEMVPAALMTYWAIYSPWNHLATQVAFISLAGLLVAISSESQPAGHPYLAATAGFTLAAILQQKGFHYHFIPAIGFFAMLLAVSIFNPRRFTAASAVMFLLLQAVLLGLPVRAWHLAHGEWALQRQLREEIDASSSYLSLAVEPTAAFPAAIHTRSRFAGLAISQIFIPAVARQLMAGATGNFQRARGLALGQATREIRRKPDLVIVSDFAMNGRRFDTLGWLKQDSVFRELWSAYRLDRSIENVTLYRRR